MHSRGAVGDRARLLGSLHVGKTCILSPHPSDCPSSLQVRDFAKTFASVGLPAYAANAAYGLAEHTVVSACLLVW